MNNNKQQIKAKTRDTMICYRSSGSWDEPYSPFETLATSCFKVGSRSSLLLSRTLRSLLDPLLVILSLWRRIPCLYKLPKCSPQDGSYLSTPRPARRPQISKGKDVATLLQRFINFCSRLFLQISLFK